VVVAGLVELEGQGGHPGSDKGRFPPPPGLSAPTDRATDPCTTAAAALNLGRVAHRTMRRMNTCRTSGPAQDSLSSSDSNRGRSMSKMKDATGQLRLKKTRRLRCSRVRTFRDLSSLDRSTGSGPGLGGHGGASPPSVERSAGPDHQPAGDGLVVNHVLI